MWIFTNFKSNNIDISYFAFFNFGGNNFPCSGWVLSSENSFPCAPASAICIIKLIPSLYFISFNAISYRPT